MQSFAPQGTRIGYPVSTAHQLDQLNAVIDIHDYVTED